MALSSDLLINYWEENPTLWDAIYQFNTSVASYTHPSHWPEAIPAKTINELLAHDRTKNDLSQWLLETHKLQDSFLSDFENAKHRLSLLDAKVLQKIFLYIGSALNQHKISKILSKNEREMLESQLGRDVFRFAIKEAPLMLGHTSAWVILENDQSEIFESVLHAAMKIFEMIFAQAPYGVKKRIELKLPAALQWAWPTNVSEEDSNRAFQLIRRFLKKLFDPKDIALIYDAASAS